MRKRERERERERERGRAREEEEKEEHEKKEGTYPLCSTVLILKPNVGEMVLISSPMNFFKMVVFPALSRPLSAADMILKSEGKLISMIITPLGY